jgi:L-alanine-DL-glutamate epimerase-like enolase superfamily enzyme
VKITDGQVRRHRRASGRPDRHRRGVDGYGQVERYKPYLKWHVLHLAPALVGEDPTNVERVMLKIRNRGGFKPWGSAVSAVEMALWDLAGKAAGLPSTSCSAARCATGSGSTTAPSASRWTGYEPEDYAANMARMKASPEGFTIIKQGVAFHSAMPRQVPVSSTATRRRSRSTATSSAAC